MSQIPQNAEANDEATLDAELAKSIADVKAGQTIAETQTGQTGETGATGADENPTGETGSTGESDGNSQAAGATGEDDIRIPNKGKFESDEAYEKRIELFDLVKRKKAATTPEAKAALSEEIKRSKGELRTLGTSERIIHPKVEDSKEGGDGTAVDPALKADQERLRALGGATKEDVQELVRQERVEQEVRSDLAKFVERTKELKDPDVREVFFDFVDKNYIWQGKTGKELITVLEMARENMFRPSETITERVLKGAGVQEKVNAMQFPGGTGGKVEVSQDVKKSIDEMVAAGMTEEKARELLSD